jgi:hypothetical protein
MGDVVPKIVRPGDAAEVDRDPTSQSVADTNAFLAELKSFRDRINLTSVTDATLTRAKRAGRP